MKDQCLSSLFIAMIVLWLLRPSIAAAFVPGPLRFDRHVIEHLSAFPRQSLPSFQPCRSKHISNEINSKRTILHLVPIVEFRTDISRLTKRINVKEETIPENKLSSSHLVSSQSCFDQQGRFYDKTSESYYLLGLAEQPDLPDLARFIVQVFGAEAIRLSSDLNSLEQLLMRPAVELVNGYSGIVAFAEVLAGLQQRLKKRIQGDLNPWSAPPLDKCETRAEKLNVASSTSLILVVAKNRTIDDPTDWHKDVIASVELRLQPCDAKIPFSWPWLDQIERRLAQWIGLVDNITTDEQARDLQPYLSNLCVDEAHRGRGLARSLVRCVENIAKDTWGYKKMYLHVDNDNKAALQLYKSEGYRDVGLRWKPFWAGRAAEIGYFVKELK